MTGDGGLGWVELLDRISMAFLVALQRLTPTERAALLLHDVFDFEHAEVAMLIGKTVPACRQLLKRAKEIISSARRTIDTPPEEHRRLLRALLRAADAGDAAEIVSMLAENAVLVVDGDDAVARFGRAKNLRVPIVGAARIAAFLAATVPCAYRKPQTGSRAAGGRTSDRIESSEDRTRKNTRPSAAACCRRTGCRPARRVVISELATLGGGSTGLRPIGSLERSVKLQAMGDGKAKNKAVFSCQFSCQLAH